MGKGISIAKDFMAHVYVFSARSLLHIFLQMAAIFPSLKALQIKWQVRRGCVTLFSGAGKAIIMTTWADRSGLEIKSKTYFPCLSVQLKRKCVAFPFFFFATRFIWYLHFARFHCADVEMGRFCKCFPPTPTYFIYAFSIYLRVRFIQNSIVGV